MTLQSVVAGRPNAGFISGIRPSVLTTQQNRKGKAESSIDELVHKQAGWEHIVFYSFYVILFFLFFFKKGLAEHPKHQMECNFSFSAVSKQVEKQQACAVFGTGDWVGRLQEQEQQQQQQQSGVCFGRGASSCPVSPNLLFRRGGWGGWSNNFHKGKNTLFSSLCLQRGSPSLDDANNY